MRVEKASYKKAILPEYQGNPLIEALPMKASDASVLDSFSFYPEYAESAREADALIREEYLTRIKTLRQPLPIYYDCYRAIDSALKSGYSTKNPFHASTSQYLHYPVSKRPKTATKTGFFEPKGEGITLVGESGVGKTSMLEQVLNYFPSVIKHTKYKGKSLAFKYQVVWIKVDCPNKSSVRDLCEEILLKLDWSLQLPESKPARTIGKLVLQIEQKIKMSYLGMLVIDEMQRLEIKRTGGENNLMSFLHSLVNKLGVPLFFCANPPFDERLARDFKAARRAESGGYLRMQSLGRDSQEWRVFSEELWELQWTSVITPFNDELSNKLHLLSLGNLDLAHRIYREAQKIVIGSKDERITTSVLDLAYSSACGITSRNEEVKENRLLLILPRSSKKKQESIKKARDEKPHVIGDIERPQHPEFEEELIEIQGAPDLNGRVRNPSLFQSATTEDDITRYLELQNGLCIEPLEIFA